MENATWYGPSPMDRPRPEPKIDDWYLPPQPKVEIPTVSLAMLAEIVAVLRLCLTIVKKTRAQRERELIARIEQMIRLLGGGA